MTSTDAIQTVYTNPEDKATLTCPHCTTTRVINVANYKQLHIPIEVACVNGCRFTVLLNTRTFYRKAVNLRGTYIQSATGVSGSMCVENLSLPGIGFRTSLPPRMQLEDMIELRFVLDNARHTEICIAVVVKWVQDRYIGAEYCDISAYKRELGFYLRPS